MVRANGQRDGVGKTRALASAFEHRRPILDSTRVSPYGPAARDMPQSMRPDTRQHLTACTRLSEEMEFPETGVNGFGRAERPSLRSAATYLPHGRQRLSSRCAAPPLRSGPVGDCRRRPCGKPLRASRKAGPRSTGAKAGLRRAAPLSRRTDPATPRAPGAEQRRLRNSLQFRRRPHTPRTLPATSLSPAGFLAILEV